MSICLRMACLLVCGGALAACPLDGLAQEPSGLAAAVAIEKALVEAIAKAERSVVAIARVRPGLGGDELAGPDNPFRPRGLRGRSPASHRRTSPQAKSSRPSSSTLAATCVGCAARSSSTVP